MVPKIESVKHNSLALRALRA